MACLSNVNEGLIQMVGRKPKLDTTYGRRNRNKSLSGVYDTMPLSPQKEFQPRRSWTSINKDQSVHQIEEASPPSNIAHKILSKSLSPSSTSAAFEPLGDSTQGGLRPRSIANVTTVQSPHVPALPSLTVSTRSPTQSRIRLPPKPTTFQLDTLKSATVETPTQAKFLPSDINQVTTGVSIIPISDDHQAGTAADNLNLGPVDNIEMADVDGDGDPGEAKQSRTHTGDNNDEYFEVEAIKSCMLGARGKVLLQVKWKGYEEPSDRTWEPERSLRNDIPQILDGYFEERGGRDKVLNDLRGKRARGTAYARKRGIAKVKGRKSK